MMKGAQDMEKKTFNNTFAMSPNYNDKPEDISELAFFKNLREVRSMINKFMAQGFIGSDEYSFITHANFNEFQNCSLDPEVYSDIVKDEEEKKQAQENINFFVSTVKAIVNYRDIDVMFCSISEKCALVDLKKIPVSDVERVITEYFEI